MEEVKEKKRKSRLSLFVDAFVVTVAGGCALMLLTIIWGMGHSIQKDLELIGNSASSNAVKLDSIEKTLLDNLAGLSARESNRDLEIDWLRSEVAKTSKNPKRGPEKIPEKELRDMVRNDLKQKLLDDMRKKIDKDKKRREDPRQFQMPF